MKIIEPGFPAAGIVYRGKCVFCETVFEANIDDGVPEVALRPSRYGDVVVSNHLRVNCPNCNRNTTLPRANSKTKEPDETCST